MPMVGAVDVMAGMAVLFAPRGLPLMYMAIWATWTALLRPLSGESVFEAVERAGNYGVPLALLLLTSVPRSIRDLGKLLGAPSEDERSLSLTRQALKWSTVVLLAGHGALGLSGKALLIGHYASIGLPPETATIVGWFEIALAVVVAVRPLSSVLLFVFGWKLATEFLFLVAGAPVWEFVERAGSYAAPFALLALTRDMRTSGRELRGLRESR
jgi:hypothetical protein